MESVGFAIPDSRFELSITSAGKAASVRNLVAVFPGSDRDLRDE
jgi:hypothetical protein